VTTTAQSIIKQAHELLQDPDGIRWKATELVAHLNDGQRALLDLRPEMFAVTAATALVAGPKQTTPAACANLMEIPRNTNGGAIYPVDRAMLDSVSPDWYTMTSTLKVKHTMVDAREPDVYYVYPPAAVGASVDLVYAAWPADVATPIGVTAATVTGNVSVDDSLKIALLHFVVARAYMVDAEFGGNANLAATHLQLFAAAAGGTKPPVADKE
jgi:hypothetical protein